MGDPVTMAAGLSIASLGMKAGASVIGGIGAKAGADFEAERAERAAELGRIKADQTDATMREELHTQLAQIDAVRASANVVTDSPTGDAIKARETQLSDRERQTRLLNIRSQVASDEAAATYKRRSGELSLAYGIVGGAGQLAGGVGRSYAQR